MGESRRRQRKRFTAAAGVEKSRRRRRHGCGRQVRVTAGAGLAKSWRRPAWTCHGLPGRLSADADLKKSRRPGWESHSLQESHGDGRPGRVTAAAGLGEIWRRLGWERHGIGRRRVTQQAWESHGSGWARRLAGLGSRRVTVRRCPPARVTAAAYVHYLLRPA